MSLKFNSVDAQAVCGVCQVTVVTTATGTLVVAGSLTTGAGAGTQGGNVVSFYGVNVVAAGANSVSMYLVNGTSTQLVGVGTATALGLTAAPGPAGFGVAGSGALVAVLGTGSGTMNILFQ
jgi:hypothetical protein